MSIFKRNIHNPKVHPLSRKVVDMTSHILSLHGISDTLVQAKCALALFQATIRHMKQTGKSKDKGDIMLQKQAEELKAIINGFGVTKIEEQEDIVLEYLAVIGSLGE